MKTYGVTITDGGVTTRDTVQAVDLESACEQIRRDMEVVEDVTAGNPDCELRTEWTCFIGDGRAEASLAAPGQQDAAAWIKLTVEELHGGGDAEHRYAIGTVTAGNFEADTLGTDPFFTCFPTLEQAIEEVEASVRLAARDDEELTNGAVYDNHARQIVWRQGELPCKGNSSWEEAFPESCPACGNIMGLCICEPPEAKV